MNFMNLNVRTFFPRMDHHCLSKLNLMGGCNVQTIEARDRNLFNPPHFTARIIHPLIPKLRESPFAQSLYKWLWHVEMCCWRYSHFRASSLTLPTGSIRCITGTTPPSREAGRAAASTSPATSSTSRASWRPTLITPYWTSQSHPPGASILHSNKINYPISHLLSVIDSLTQHEWASWTMNHFLSE